MPFKIVGQDPKTSARAGIFTTAHGEVRTPAFMPVATKGTVKTLCVEELEEIGTEMIIANALHLYLRPGHKKMESAGGLHKYMNFRRTIITDSGGFQILRKDFNIKRSDEGLSFRDFFSGAPHFYTPETCMQVQKAIGSDVAMLLDDVPPHGASPAEIRLATQRSIDWAHRGIATGRELGIPNLFAITQGGTDPALRRWCAEEMEKLNPDGYGIGGLSIGESKEEMNRILSESTHLLPAHKPRYLMGVGSAREILDSIALGVDIFDSVFPTQCARHGTIFTAEGRITMKGLKMEQDDRPLDEKCTCKICRTYTRAYINHLLREKEMLGMRLASYHNVYYVLDLVRRARAAILEGRFDEFRKSTLPEVPAEPVSLIK